MVVGSRNDQRTIQRKVVQSTLFAGAIAASKVALAELLLCLILFAACAAHVRLRLRYAPSAATDPS